jgi:1-acyl-sn-glycerol-3-phosphate acyltransferase
VLDKVVSFFYNETVKKKRTKYEITTGIQTALEKSGHFNVAYMPQDDDYIMPTERYPFRPRGLGKIATAFWRTAMQLVAPVAIRIGFGAKVVGRKNLRALKKQGAICVCNHFNYLDTLFVREAAGYYRTYHTMGPWNNKKGLGGHIIRQGGMLPFSADRLAMRKLLSTMGELLKEGKIVNFYAEQAMWKNYQKPRPMKEGAFHYAVKFSVPVLPIFCTFQKGKRGNIRKLRINILPAVYPDESLPRAERIEVLRAAAQTAWRECYEQAYGIPLVYETK